jgi:hypothetical protein
MLLEADALAPREQRLAAHDDPEHKRPAEATHRADRQMEVKDMQHALPRQPALKNPSFVALRATPALRNSAASAGKEESEGGEGTAGTSRGFYRPTPENAKWKMESGSGFARLVRAGARNDFALCTRYGIGSLPRVPHGPAAPPEWSGGHV